MIYFYFFSLEKTQMSTKKSLLARSEDELNKRKTTIAIIKQELNDAGISTDNLKSKDQYIQKYLESQKSSSKTGKSTALKTPTSPKKTSSVSPKTIPKKVTKPPISPKATPKKVTKTPASPKTISPEVFLETDVPKPGSSKITPSKVITPKKVVSKGSPKTPSKKEEDVSPEISSKPKSKPITKSNIKLSAKSPSKSVTKAAAKSSAKSSSKSVANPDTKSHSKPVSKTTPKSPSKPVTKPPPKTLSKPPAKPISKPPAKKTLTTQPILKGTQFTQTLPQNILELHLNFVNPEDLDATCFQEGYQPVCSDLDRYLKIKGWEKELKDPTLGLFHAVQVRSKTLVDYFFKKGGEIEPTKEKRMISALPLSISVHDLDMLQHLLSLMKQKGQNPTFSTGNVKLYFIDDYEDYDQNPLYKNSYQLPYGAISPLDIPIFYGDYLIYRYLANKGYQTQLEENDNQITNDYTPAPMAIAAYNGSFDILRSLLFDRKHNPDSVGGRDSFRFIIDHKDQLSDHIGNPRAIEIASGYFNPKHANLAIVKLLTEAGADLSKKFYVERLNKNMDLAQLAEISGHPDIKEYLEKSILEKKKRSFIVPTTVKLEIPSGDTKVLLRKGSLTEQKMGKNQYTLFEPSNATVQNWFVNPKDLTEKGKRIYQQGLDTVRQTITGTSPNKALIVSKWIVVPTVSDNTGTKKEYHNLVIKGEIERPENELKSFVLMIADDPTTGYKWFISRNGSVYILDKQKDGGIL